MRFDVTGIGNAIVDVLADVDDSFLEEHLLSKGSMRLIDEQQATTIYEMLQDSRTVSGGSAANTIAGVASLGGSASFIGRVADDDLGEVFAAQMREVGVHFDMAAAAGEKTGRSMIMVTPDAQRTMSTYLGVSTQLTPADLLPDLIQSAKIVYLEGYLFDLPDAQTAFHEAARLAAESGTKVAFSLSDAFCIERHRDSFLHLIETGVDILFGNEAEIHALYGTSDLEAAGAALRGHCEVAALTRGAKGSIIVTPDSLHRIPAIHPEKLVDTTGAGDLYAAGVLYGISRNLPPAEAAHIGSIAACEVISHMGARPQTPLSGLIRQETHKSASSA